MSWTKMIKILCVLSISLSMTAQAEEHKLTISTGDLRGIYYPLGQALASILNKQITGMHSKVVNSRGSLQNLQMVLARRAQLAFSTANVVYLAQHGLGRYETKGQQPIRAIAAIYPNVLQIVQLDREPIHGLDNIFSKRISVGAIGSGTETMNKEVFEALGMPYQNFSKLARLSYAQTLGALRGNLIDIGSFSVGLGSQMLHDLADGGNMSLICLNAEQQKQISAAYPYYSQFTIPAKTYRGINQNCHSVQVANHLFVHADMDEELAYKITRTLFEHTEQLSFNQALASGLSIDYALQNTVIPLHPGAYRYFQEQKANIPEHLKPQ